MKNWAKEENGSIWIPTMMTLPTGMLYPFNNEEGNMKWGYAKMEDIPQEERKDYPVPGQDGKFYERKYDTDKARVYDHFYEALHFLNEEAKEEIKSQKQPVKLNLPKLKKSK